VLEEPTANRVILAVFPPGEDRSLLHNILNNSRWQLVFTRTLEETKIALRSCSVAVILSEGVLSDGHGWKDILYELQIMSNSPALIVADRLADEALWAEVLNLGGHDLLTKPFDAKELLHALTTACHFDDDQRERAPATGEAAKAVGCASVPGTRGVTALAAGG